MKYKKDWQLWELCINLRKFLTVAALLFLAFDTSAQIIVMALIVLLFMILSVMCDDDGSLKYPAPRRPSSSGNSADRTVASHRIFWSFV